MELTQREYNILQICFDCKDYIYSYRPTLMDRIINKDDFNSNYDFVMALYKMIDEEGADLTYFKDELLGILEYQLEELSIGVLDLSYGKELPLISRILYELEHINWVPPKKMPPLPDFVETF